MRSARVNEVLGSIGANVRRLRKQRGLTQEKLAELAGAEARWVQEVEGGRANSTITVLVALADALKVDPRVLLEPARLAPATPGRPRKKTPKKRDVA
jgi:transcriptional regulator with XRE-family HTH domain